MPANDSTHIYGYLYYSDLSLTVQDCQFHGGSVYSTGPSLSPTNCLFERVYTGIYPTDGGAVYKFRNSLFVGGTLDFYDFDTNQCNFRDNLFDKTTIYCSDSDAGWNAYITGSNRLTPTNSGDVVLSASPAYETSYLGRYYLPTNATALINTGSVTNAGLVGLYHYTSTANQTKETNSIVNISFHYVATDSSALPLDSDGDGYPDCSEDRNGNGTVDSGETDWNNATDLGLRVVITRPRNGSTIP
jgi:hypothetical protein